MYDTQIAEDYIIPFNQLFFCTDALRRKSFGYIIWLITAFGIALAAYAASSTKLALFVYYFILTVHMIFRLRGNASANILSLDILFIAVYTMFHLGYVTFYALGIMPYMPGIILFIGSVPKALFIINIGLISFLLGYEILGSSGNVSTFARTVKIPRASWCLAGAVLMVLALVMHLSVLVRMVPFYQQYGYKALQNISDYATSFFLVLLWSNCIFVMVLGLVIYTMSSVLRYGKLFKSKLALALVIFYLVLVILEGDRGPIVQIGIPLLLIRHYFVKKVKMRYLILFLFAALFLYTALGAVRHIVLSPEKMIEEYQYKKGAGEISWMNPFTSLGGSFLVVNIVSHEVPSVEPYWKGASWLDGLLHIVPFLQGILTKLGYASTHGWFRWPPSTWVTTTYFGKDASGRAFTIAAEGYLNFGYIGVIIELMFFGMAVRWLAVKFSRAPSAALGCIMLICYGILVFAIRNHVGNMFNHAVHLVLIIAVLNKFLASDFLYEYEEDLAEAYENV